VESGFSRTYVAERMIPSGHIVTLTIEKPAVGGRMIARLDGRIALVGGAIPGERVRARIERVAKGVVYGETIEVEEASADRRPFVDRSCGGCLYGHIAYPRQLAIKAQVIEDAFRRIGRLSLPSVPGVAASPEDGYRMRARLHARGGRIGFFREGTHAVCDPRHTRQLLPATCETIEALEQTIRSVGLDEIREIDLSENVDASERVVFVDAASAIDAGVMESLAATPGLTGCVSAFGSWSGSPSVIDRVTVAAGLEVALRRHVLAFFQGNRHLLAPFVAHVVGLVPTSGRLLDLYAGVGLFAVSAAARGVEVTAVEGDRVAAADLASNAASAAGPVEAVHQSVEDFVATRARGEPPAAVIADPPRTGMSREALDGIVAHRPARAIYVSCDVATLARDARRLVDAGYAVSRIDAFDLFPNTPHVETVVVFDRTTQG
jgi:23S rRNA (uracil1939-C5)-methyltransferase